MSSLGEESQTEGKVPGKRARALLVAGLFLAAAGSSFLLSQPAQAGAVNANCAVGIYGKNHDGITITCGSVLGGQARGRADCSFAPDIYTDWITSFNTKKNCCCLFKAATAILELRPF
jgi:hypothetical protein